MFFEDSQDPEKFMIDYLPKYMKPYGITNKNTHRYMHDRNLEDMRSSHYHPWPLFVARGSNRRLRPLVVETQTASLEFANHFTDRTNIDKYTESAREIGMSRFSVYGGTRR